MWLEIQTRKSSILVGYIYRNPASTFDWYDQFVTMMDRVQGCNVNVVLLGDFNTDMQKSNPAWDSTKSLFGLNQMITSPTRITPHSSTLIDHIYTSDTSIVSNILVPATGISDHFPVCCTLSVKTVKPVLNVHSSIVYRCFKQFDERAFLMDLHVIPFKNVYNFSDPNVALSHWIDLFLDVINKHAPLKKKRVKQQTLPPWLNTDIKQAMLLRDKCRKQKKFVEYKQQRNRVNYLVREAKKKYFNDLAGNKADISSMWRAINTLTKGHSPANNNLPSELTPDVFNAHFVSVVSKFLPDDQTDGSQYNCPNRLLNFCRDRISQNTTFSIPSISVFEVGISILKLDNKKSTGCDGISVKLLKIALPYIAETLTYIYNLCIQKNVFPTAFKRAKVIPLPKTKTISTDLNDYRPISILSVLTKPLERHIHKHLTNFLETHQLFHSFQSGFRCGHSCQTAVTRLTDIWLSAFNNRQMSGAVFLDFRKAFDLVHHDILLKKLSTYNLSIASIAFLRSYLQDRIQCVLVNGTYSQETSITSGVPQGSILGPLLFCIFINDLPLCLTRASVQCDLFADDGTLNTANDNIDNIRGDLQQSLYDVSGWCCRNRMALNPTKTKCMLMATRQKHQKKQLPLNLKFETTPIEQVSKHRLLGVTVDDQLKWQAHINNMCKTVSRNIFLLSKLSQIVSQKSKLAFFFAHIMSHMNYVSNAWDGCAGVHMKQLYSLHKRAVKFLMPIPNLDYKQKCCALKLLPLDKQLLLNKCVLMQKVVHGKAPQYLKDLMIPSERLHVHGNKQLLPRTRIDIFKTSFSFSGSLAWNSLAHHLRYPMEVKTFKRKAFQALARPP